MSTVSLNHTSLPIQFIVACRQMLAYGVDRETIVSNLDNRERAGRAANVFKAAVGAQTLADGWLSNDGRIISEAFFGTLAQVSLLDAALAAGAKRIPEAVKVGLFASGAAVATTTEGAPTAVTRLTPDIRTMTPVRADAIIVTSRELAQSEDGAATQLIGREISAQVVAASNLALLAQLTAGSASAGADAVASLKAGLAAADDSRAYIVAAKGEDVRALAMASENGMGVGGGEYIPGVHVVRANVQHMTVVPVDTLAVVNHGAAVEPSTEADVQMSSAPSVDSDGVAVEANVVSLFQTGSVGILVHRMFAARGTCVEVA